MRAIVAVVLGRLYEKLVNSASDISSLHRRRRDSMVSMFKRMVLRTAMIVLKMVALIA